MHNGHDLDRARDALQFIPPDLPRDEWLRAGMAAKAIGLSFDDWVDWSAKAGNYDARAARDTWRSIKPDGGIGPGTLYSMAAELGGWRMNGGSNPRHRPGKAPGRPVERAKPPRPGVGIAEVWARCKPATAEHPYIVRKGAAGVPLDMLRVVQEGDPLRIAGASVAEWLVVPVLPLKGGEPVSLQFIPPPGAGSKKLNLQGARMDGMFVVGDMVAGGTMFLCEGVGTAWACWQATGAAAVVAFGWGNVRRVAAELRQRDAEARLVLVPDVGKESAAERIALEAGADVVTMPAGSPPNFDANDYALAEGFDALEALLQSARRPEPAPGEVHPLARFIDLDATPKPPRMVIPGFIQAGVVVISGGHGSGKTTVLVPLAMVAAGLHAELDPLAPPHWRHVVYIAEDAAQVQRILTGVVDHAGIGSEWVTVCERFHVVPAMRLPPNEVAAAGPIYSAHFTRTVDGVEVPPLVVIDTKSATIEVDDENDNAEAGRTLALFKQQFADLPLWLVGHVAKALATRKEAAGLSARGASAIEADAHQTVFLVVEDDGRRFLALGKRRFEPRWLELEVMPGTAEVAAVDEFKRPQALTLRWGILAPPTLTRDEAREAAREREATEALTELRGAILDTVDAAWKAGTPTNRAGVAGTLHKKKADVLACIAALEAESWLVAVPIPPANRTHPSRREFLVRLEDNERRDYIDGKGLPGAKAAMPKAFAAPTRQREPMGTDAATEAVQ